MLPSPHVLPDADDDMIANCAINGMADCVVTNNVRHLRVLEQQFGIPVIKPEPFVKQVERVVFKAKEVKL